MLTMNEKKVLRFLATSIEKDYSINDIAKICKITPNGTYKLLNKLRKECVLKVKPIANIKSYKLDFNNEKTTRVIELAFLPDTPEGRIKLRTEDLQPLKTLTKACILFGSYISAKQKPADLDVMFILEKKNFKAYKQTLAKVQDRTPIKIQDAVQTVDDLKQNLEKSDPVLIQALREGIVLWGVNILIKVIKHVHER